MSKEDINLHVLSCLPAFVRMPEIFVCGTLLLSVVCYSAESWESFYQLLLHIVLGTYHSQQQKKG
jgi:hypothetical protein